MRRILLACLLTVALLHALPILRGPVPWEGVGQISTLVRFDFTNGSFADAGGRLMLHASAVSGGELILVPGASGWALEFPPVCDMARDCPRAILESDQVDWLSPGTRRVQWGASVRMTSHQVSDGANVLQKGLSAAGTQFKLQVDGDAGHPSCVVAGQIDDSHYIFVAMSADGIADGAWHDVVCLRDGGMLSLFVDGWAVAESAMPIALSIVNDLPLRVGGKGHGPNNDQFHGTLDNVFVEIG